MTGPYLPPHLHILLDGAPLADESHRALHEVRIQQRLSQPTVGELTFREPPERLLALAIPGATVSLEIPATNEQLLDGEIVGIEYGYGPAHEQEFRLRCYDRLHRLRWQQSIRPHVQVTPGELLNQMAGGLGLTVEAPDSGTLWQQCIQYQPSDLDFLTLIAARNGLYWTLWGDRLHLITLEGLGTALPLELGAGLLTARFEFNAQPDTQTVTTRGWSALRVEPFEGRSTQPRSGRTAGGFSIRGALENEEYFLLNAAVQDAQHADALAQAELDRRAARRIIFRGTAEGDPRLRPGARVALQGVAPQLAGQYVLTAVNHCIDDRSGFISEFSTVPPPPPPPIESDRLTLGNVTRVDDPDSLGRIQVSLPAYSDIETAWMQVLSLGAGAEKGWVVLPDVGDRVLVWLPGADPTGGIVLGGLYGMTGPYDSGVDADKVQRYTLRTRGGHKIRLDDTAKTLRIENSTGSYTEMTPDKVRLHAASDLEVEAPGHRITIRGQAIDFEEG